MFNSELELSIEDMKIEINNFFENKIANLPLFVKYIIFRDNSQKVKREMAVKNHNTSKYSIRIFYKLIHPINLNEKQY